jgi:hypothetical protein
VIPGTTSELVLTASEFTWSFLINSRPSIPSNFNTAVDSLVWNIVPSISNSPQIDLYTGMKDARSSDLSKLTIKGDGGNLILQSIQC